MENRARKFKEEGLEYCNLCGHILSEVDVDVYECYNPDCPLDLEEAVV